MLRISKELKHIVELPYNIIFLLNYSDRINVADRYSLEVQNYILISGLEIVFHDKLDHFFIKELIGKSIVYYE